MLDVLQFVLSGFWIFVGTLMLISAVGWAIARIILALRGVALPCQLPPLKSTTAPFKGAA